MLIVDDHSIVREGLALLVRDAFAIENISFASDKNEAMHLVYNHAFDLVSVDLSLSYSMEGFDIVKEVRKIQPSTKIIVFSMYDEADYQKKAFNLGADGYLVKRQNGDEVVQGIKDVLTGKKLFNYEAIAQDDSMSWELPLSHRETEVFILTVYGHSMQEIADKLNISSKTVENHRRNIRTKLQIKKKSEWVEVAKKYKLLTR